jgi:hypothetical protein
MFGSLIPAQYFRGMLKANSNKYEIPSRIATSLKSKSIFTSLKIPGQRNKASGPSNTNGPCRRMGLQVNYFPISIGYRFHYGFTHGGMRVYGF